MIGSNKAHCVFSFLLFPVVVLSDTLVESKIEHCEVDWQKTLEISDEKVNEALQVWREHGHQCSGTGIYEYRLAALYERSGDLEKSNAIVNKALKDNLPYRHFLQVSRLSNEFAALVQTDPYSEATRSKLEAIERSLETLILSRPDGIPVAYETLSLVQLFIDKNEKAAVTITKGLKLKKSSWALQRNLAIAYARLGQYLEAKILIVEAVQLNKALLSDGEFMLAAAFVYVKLDEFEAAKAVLLSLAQRDPSIVEDAGYQRLASYVVEELK